MRGFILAAGFGTRMRPLTDHIPKALVPVCGKPLLERALEFIHKNGIDRIGVNAHYMPEQIRAFRSQSPVKFDLFVESGNIRGTGGAFDNAREFLSGDETFFMLNVDIICDFDLKAAIRRFMKSIDVCTLIAFPCVHGEGTILYDRQSRLYHGTPSEIGRPESSMDGAYIGAALYKREFLDLVTPDDFSIVPVWKRAADKGLSVSVDLQQSGYWRDIGTIKALADIHFDRIDKKIDIAVPPHLTCWPNETICIPAESVNRKSAFSGNYAWIESESFRGSTVDHSLVWRNTDIKNMNIANSLYTPFGVIPIS